MAGRSPGEQALKPHHVFIQWLAARRKLIQNGPWQPDNNIVTVVEVASLAEAQSLVPQDPAVQSRLLQARIIPWDIVFGLGARGVWPTAG